jgi:hypothetical protein
LLDRELKKDVHLVRYSRKGGFLDTSRRRRGLGPLDRGGP